MIDKEKKYSISQVSKITGYETHVLRYYETDFNLKIPRTNSNRRYYTYKEIERLIYIKELQAKGLTNKQIKLILESPELIVPANNEVAATSTEELTVLEENNSLDVVEMTCMNISDAINSNINCKLEETKNEIITYIESSSIKEKETLKEPEEITKEKDVLICENARLKMKVKEKSYEVAELKEKLNRSENKKIPFWKKVFGKK